MLAQIITNAAMPRASFNKPIDAVSALFDALMKRILPPHFEAILSLIMRSLMNFRHLAIGSLLLTASLASSGCRYVAQGQNTAGVRSFEQGNYQGAVQQFNQALANDPNNPDAYYNLARIYHRQATASRRKEDYDQAERLYNQCLDKSPNHVDCHRALAVMLIEENRTAEAFRLLERWSLREPNLSSAKVELARLHQEHGKREVARDALIQALAVNPYDARALAALGRMYEQDGDSNSALATYQRSLQANPLQPELAQRVATMRGVPLTTPGLAVPPAGTRTVTQPPPVVNSQRY